MNDKIQNEDDIIEDQNVQDDSVTEEDMSDHMHLKTQDASIVQMGESNTEKTLTNTDQSGCKDNVPDVEIFGGDLFKLLSKASSKAEGWMKSTKAMQVKGGCVIQVTTQQRNPNGSYAIAEALTFVPNVVIAGTETNRFLK